MTPAFVDDDPERYGPRYEPPFPRLRPPPVYRARLGELDGCHLEITCACGNRANRPVSAFARFYGGPEQTLGGMLCRLECSRCKAKPVKVLLNECALKHFAYGPPRGWSVQVWPIA